MTSPVVAEYMGNVKGNSPMQVAMSVPSYVQFEESDSIKPVSDMSAHKDTWSSPSFAMTASIQVSLLLQCELPSCNL
jgi:hypothetical protein